MRVQCVLVRKAQSVRKHRNNLIATVTAWRKQKCKKPSDNWLVNCYCTQKMISPRITDRIAVQKKEVTDSFEIWIWVEVRLLCRTKAMKLMWWKWLLRTVVLLRFWEKRSKKPILNTEKERTYQKLMQVQDIENFNDCFELRRGKFCSAKEAVGQKKRWKFYSVGRISTYGGMYW